MYGMKHVDGYLANMITEIKQMAVALVVLNKNLKKRIGELESEKKKLEEEKNTLERRVRALQESCDTMKLATAITGGENKGEAKMQISKLMREIDQCIVLIQNL